METAAGMQLTARAIIAFDESRLRQLNYQHSAEDVETGRDMMANSKKKTTPFTTIPPTNAR